MNRESHKRRADVNQDGPRQNQKSGRFGEVRLYSCGTEREIGHEVLSGYDDLKSAIERLKAKAPSERQFVAQVVLDPKTVNKIPTNESERRSRASEVEEYVTEELSYLLSPADLEQFRRYRLEPPDKAALPRICAAMDSVILQEAVEQGPEIFLMPEILQRVTDWTLEGEDGERRCERLGRAFARCSRVIRGLQTAPLDPRWVRSRPAIVQEVKELRKSLGAKFADRHNPPPEWVLLNALRDTVLDMSEGKPTTMFPKLGQIELSFEAFVHAEPTPFRQLLTGHLTPALFTDQLIGWITNYEPGSVPQLIRRHS